MKENQLEIKKRKKTALAAAGLLILTAVFIFMFYKNSYAGGFTVLYDDGNGGNSLDSLDVLFLFLFLAVVPSFILMMTSFTRIIIVLSFLRNALGTQQSPPNQILIGLALILTLFIMSPVIGRVNAEAYQPYRDGAITREEAFDKAQVPVKEFMLKQTEKKSLDLFMQISKTEPSVLEGEEGPQRYMNLDLTVVVPSFILSELNRAFTMGFLIFLPFLIIDLVVASTLMSMGMVMLPPTMIALPFKLMLFVLVDGWDLVIKTLVQGFR